MPSIPLICIPFAGAGASFFHPWSALAGESLKIVALQPPGREWKLLDEPYRDAAEAAAGLLPEALEQIERFREAGEIGDSGEVALFGHSLGAVLAYELGQLLAARDDVELVRIFVSGSPGPWTGRSDRATGLDDEEFLLRVQEFAGYSHEALANAEMRELILPILRADVELHESYVPSTDDPLPVPITSLRGRTDELVTTEQAGEWSKATSGEFSLIEVDGGHMYLTEDTGGLLRLLEDQLSGRPARR
ncbi:alpha/beta fold hydrolase [Streptomyces sp. NPDC041068]|uniref:thioesterase II family protein n=1 Tax=Streptomyces sp. NPDC041068 TaxID=3155130 RepID=UPI00340F185E